MSSSAWVTFTVSVLKRCELRRRGSRHCRAPTSVHSGEATGVGSAGFL